MASSSQVEPPAAESSGETSKDKKPSPWSRILSSENKDTAVQFFSAYANTWIGLSPIWLMGEAVIPGAKVGSRFRKGRVELATAASNIRKAVATSSKDIVVVVDSSLADGKQEAAKVAEVLKASRCVIEDSVGDDAILVVTSSIEKLRSCIEELDVTPQLKKTIEKNGRDVVVVLDKALKNPLVVTGVTKYAKSKGIPHAEALLQLASLALSKLLKALPEDATESTGGDISEIDAISLESTSRPAEAEHARELGRQAAGTPPPLKKKTSDHTSCCII